MTGVGGVESLGRQPLRSEDDGERRGAAPRTLVQRFEHQIMRPIFGGPVGVA